MSVILEKGSERERLGLVQEGLKSCKRHSLNKRYTYINMI